MRLSNNYEFISKQILQILHKSASFSSCPVLFFRSMRRTSFLRYRVHTKNRDFHVILFNQISGFTFPYLIFMRPSAVKGEDHRLCRNFGFRGISSHTYEMRLSFLQSESRFYLQNGSGKSFPCSQYKLPHHVISALTISRPCAFAFYRTIFQLLFPVFLCLANGFEAKNGRLIVFCCLFGLWSDLIWFTRF